MDCEAPSRLILIQRKISSTMCKRIVLLVFITILFGCSNSPKDETMKDKWGPINNERDARKIAERIWVLEYGKDVKKFKPYDVRLINDSLWVVCGNLPKDMIGGVPYLTIRKNDGLIIELFHTK